jgi:hypothetical protein
MSQRKEVTNMILMNVVENNTLNLVAYDENGTRVSLQITSDMTAQQIMDGLSSIMESGFSIKAGA